SNNYAGSTTINLGTVQLGAANAIPSTSAVSLANVAGVTLNLITFSDTIGSLAGGGTTGGNVILGSGTLTAGSDNTSTTFAGTISGTGGLTKAGAGTLTLTSAASSYSGQTIINAGTLITSTLASSGTNSSIGTGSGNSTILVGSASAATLSYTG